MENNHRCKGSLDRALTIKKDYRFERWLRQSDDVPKWRIFYNAYDDENMSYYRTCFTDIEYCPFCGKKLEESE